MHQTPGVFLLSAVWVRYCSSAPSQAAGEGRRIVPQTPNTRLGPLYDGQRTHPSPLPRCEDNIIVEGMLSSHPYIPLVSPHGGPVGRLVNTELPPRGPVQLNRLHPWTSFTVVRNRPRLLWPPLRQGWYPFWSFPSLKIDENPTHSDTTEMSQRK